MLEFYDTLKIRMKKFVIQSILLFVVIGGALYFFSPIKSNRKIELPFLPQSSTLVNIQINNVFIKAEVADNPSKRSKGLSDRESLASDSGMLFLFNKSDRYNFWMKGVKIPLDFIWILGDKVVDLTLNASPPVLGEVDSALTIYSPKTEIDKILEVNAGFISANNIKVGDTVIVN